MAIKTRFASTRFTSPTYKICLLNLAVIALTVAIATPFSQLYRQFEDGGFITYFSVIQLLIASYFTGQIFKRRSLGRQHPWRSPVAVWAIMSLGFSFLALDDLLMIHEFIDKSIHKLWQIQETGWSDRIDDLIIGLYGVLAIWLLFTYRKELKRYLFVTPLVLVAFVLLFVMVGIDAVTNRDDVMLHVMQLSADTVAYIQSWIFVVEDGLKVIVEGLLIAAIYQCRQKVFSESNLASEN